ncbi:hypothetical protein L1887_58117 [Cichorium endivia]|nr:hypothetical protein L1887_58117 [Cichorium endivia]
MAGVEKVEPELRREDAADGHIPQQCPNRHGCILVLGPRRLCGPVRASLVLGQGFLEKDAAEDDGAEIKRACYGAWQPERMVLPPLSLAHTHQPPAQSIAHDAAHRKAERDEAERASLVGLIGDLGQHALEDGNIAIHQPGNGARQDHLWECACESECVDGQKGAEKADEQYGLAADAVREARPEKDGEELDECKRRLDHAGVVAQLRVRHRRRQVGAQHRIDKGEDDCERHGLRHAHQTQHKQLLARQRCCAGPKGCLLVILRREDACRRGGRVIRLALHEAAVRGRRRRFKTFQPASRAECRSRILKKCKPWG